MGAGIAAMDALLLGRRTYDIFAGYWPHQDGRHRARQLNAVPKYVASRGTPDLDWPGSTLLGPDLVAEVRAVRDRHESTHVIGSVDLVQTLLAERLFDVLTLWVYPIVLGQGKKVFPDGVRAVRAHAARAARDGSAGAVLLRYAPTGADPAHRRHDRRRPSLTATVGTWPGRRRSRHLTSAAPHRRRATCSPRTVPRSAARPAARRT